MNASKTASRQPSKSASDSERRTHCNFCGDSLPGHDALVKIRCNIRRFANECFHMWRCPTCRCLHCWEIVDLDRYYEGYGTKDQKLDFFSRVAYSRLLARFRAGGLRPDHQFLDYGCGSGNLVRFLQDRSFPNAVGYDPYGESDGMGDPALLNPGSYDFICSQDVIEHVEDGAALVAKLASLLRPNGVLQIGTPSADHIDHHNTRKHLHQLHVPYHLHLYTRKALEEMGSAAGLTPIRHYDRFYAETPLFAMNEAFARAYLSRLDDNIDSLIEPPHVAMVLLSPLLLFHATFGYWYSPRHSVTVVLKKMAR